ncbi:DHH family phosphoesterase [Planctomicrobium piriforme]|uniref:Phosphoesterase RecJ domain-containing protein n=1 Tax=Planctomicrobium piriforme TaxID=1576369 RepID=A0A1I3PIE6_9PLAN|nr:bifunctional oligoribonuclease/PAP phosphatase NrnA [Planctomicrobium piriforme]SFJ21161.1 phosphoesterase RecJ domain-containing protein [Planctomicrobium piriforme]
MPIDWQPLIRIIDAHERFVISSHVRPDADAIGSEMGLASLLQHRGKQVRVVNPSPTPNHLKFLDPQGLIQKIGGAASIAAVCDTDVHIVVDTSAWQQLQDVGTALRKSTAVKVVVDHHLSSDDLGAIEFKDVTAAAAGVLVTELIEAAGDPFSPVQADALFAAMATDTGWFRFPNVDARTLRTAARLVDAGVQPHAIYRELYERSSLARLKLHSVALGRVTLACGGRIAHTLVTRQDFVDTGAQPSDTEDLVNSCLTIEGAEAAFILVEQADGNAKGSLRSRSDLSVAAIAEQFGGGGHRQAAGVMLPGPILTAQATLLTAFEKAMGGCTAQ